MPKAVSKILWVGLLVSIGCSKPTPPTQHQTPPDNFPKEERVTDTPSIPTPLNEAEYKQSVVNSDFGLLTLYSIGDSALIRKFSEASSNTLKKLNIPGSASYSVYSVDTTDQQGSILIAPKVLIRSSLNSTPIGPHISEQGEIKLDVTLALVNGLKTEIATGQGFRKIPDEFTIPNQVSFLSSLQDALGRTPQFISEIPCPKSVTIQIQDQTKIDVQFSSRLKVCPINTFFPAQISLNTSDWMNLLLVFGRGESVLVGSDIDLSASVVLEFAKFNLDPNVVRATVNRLLEGKIDPFTSIFVENLAKEIVVSIQRSFNVNYPEEFFLDFRDQLIQKFFTPADKKGCPEDTCYYRNPNLTDDLNFDFEVKNVAFVGPQLTVHSETTVSDVLSDRQEFTIKSVSDNPLLPPDRGETNSLFATVQEGSLLELKIQDLQVGAVELANPTHDRRANPVCLDPFGLCNGGDWRCTNPNTEPVNCRDVCTGGTEQVCVQTTRVCDPFFGTTCVDVCVKWEDRCKGWTRVCDQRRVCDRLSAPGKPSLPYRLGDPFLPTDPNFEWVCTQLEQNECDSDQWEDHWESTTMWSLPSLTPELQPSPWSADYLQSVIQGFKIQFSSLDPSIQLISECALSDFEYQTVGSNRILIWLKNTDKCRPFNDLNRQPGHGPSLSIISQVSLPTDFQCGGLTERWDGKRTYICRFPDGSEFTQETTVIEDEGRMKRHERVGIWKTYYPKTQIHGSLRIVGSYFESQGIQ